MAEPVQPPHEGHPYPPSQSTSLGGISQASIPSGMSGNLFGQVVPVVGGEAPTTTPTAHGNFSLVPAGDHADFWVAEKVCQKKDTFSAGVGLNNNAP